MPIGRRKSTAIQWATVCWLGVILAAGGVYGKAEDPSQAGLAALDAGLFEQALPLLEAAVAREPTDAFLHYALGITAVQQGQDVLAAAALQRAVELEPDLPGAQAELGLTLARLGEREAALDHLLEALLQGPDDPDVLLQLGILDAEDGQSDRALRYFAEAAEMDPQVAGAAWYESAGVALDQGDLGSAVDYLEKAAESPGSEAAAKEARELLAALRPPPPRRLVLWGGFGFEYDDNLTLSDVDLTTGIGDTATLFDASLDAFLVRRPDLQISVGYDFYQSLYTTLSAFDLQSNSPHVEIAAGSGPLIGSAAYRFTYDTLGGEAFLATHRGDFALEYSFIPYIVGSLGARVEGQNFEQVPIRSAQRITLEMGVRLIDPNRPVTFEIGWRPIWNDAEGPEFDYFAQAVTAGVFFSVNTPLRPLNFLLSYDWEYRDYENITPSIAKKRYDRRHLAGTGLSVPLFGPTELALDYLFIASRSNLPGLTFNENIVSFRLGLFY
ncbi:MAG: hypothetical protein CBC48_18605 [bacterium TMED88]|nr:hypothetical protein [Deltaproteobacteria bacterium]OUV23457.1 MAG: hypothetical protein CBC48_18605 [bacterium TMED88]